MILLLSNSISIKIEIFFLIDILINFILIFHLIEIFLEKNQKIMAHIKGYTYEQFQEELSKIENLDSLSDLVNLDNPDEIFNSRRKYRDFISCICYENCYSYDFEFLFTSRSFTKDFSYLDNYNERIVNFIVTHVMYSQLPNLEFAETYHLMELFETITISDYLEILIIFKNEDCLKWRDSKIYSDRELREFALDATINRMKNEASKKLEKINCGKLGMLENISINLNFTDLMTNIRVPRFVLTDEYFEILFNGNFSQSDTINLDIDSTFEHEIIKQIRKYFTTNVIDINTDLKIVETLYYFSHRYFFKLFDICEKIMELDTPYRIKFSDLSIVGKKEVTPKIHILDFSDGEKIIALFTNEQYQFIRNLSKAFCPLSKLRMLELGIFPLNMEKFKIETGFDICHRMMEELFEDNEEYEEYEEYDNDFVY